MCGGEGGAEVQLGLDNVDADDLAGTVSTSDSSAEETDRAGTHDNNAITGLDSRLLDNVDGDSEGLDHGTLLQRHVLRKLVAEIGRSVPQSRQCSVVRRRRSKLHIVAEVVVTRSAIVASSARVSRLQRNAVTRLEILHGRTALDNSTGRGP